MTYSEDELYDLLGEADDMPYGRVKSRALETVIAHADAQGLTDLAVEARMDLTASYSLGGEAEKIFVPFAWCLATRDRDPAAFSYEHGLLWRYKWIIMEMIDHPEIGLAQIDRALDDYERRVRQSGGGMNPVHMLRCRVADYVGRTREAAERYRAWCAAPRDENSDCAGCEPTHKADHLIVAGRDDDAIAVAAPVLSGELSCWIQPRSIRSTLLLPYLRTGRYDDAVRTHRELLLDEHATDEDGEPYDLSTQLAFYVAAGHDARALEVLEPHLPRIAGLGDRPDHQMWLAASGALVMRRLDDGGRGAMVLHGTTVREWLGSLRGLAERVAARFDARNGTEHISGQVAAWMATEPADRRLALRA